MPQVDSATLLLPFADVGGNRHSGPAKLRRQAIEFFARESFRQIVNGNNKINSEFPSIKVAVRLDGHVEAQSKNRYIPEDGLNRAEACLYGN